MSGPQRPRARIRLALVSVTVGRARERDPVRVGIGCRAREHAPAVEGAGDRGHLHPRASGAGQTPPVGSIHLAMVETAVYDAVNAIDRGHEPYLRNLPRVSRSASKAAAVATAAHHVLVGLVPALADSIKSNLDTAYTASIATIPSGWRKRTPGTRSVPSRREDAGEPRE